LQTKMEVFVRAIQGWAGINVGIEIVMTVREAVRGNGVIVEIIGMREMGTRRYTCLPMSFKILKIKGLTQRVSVRKICFHAFSPKLKGRTKF